MKIKDLVNKVNALSSGETSYTYTDIQPFFQEALYELNAALVDDYRAVDTAPTVDEYDSAPNTIAYTFISDRAIDTYVAYYIVVAMDNAELAVTSRTQMYMSKLEQYKQQVINELYSYMPIRKSVTSAFTGARQEVPRVNAEVIFNEPPLKDANGNYNLVPGMLLKNVIKQYCRSSNPYVTLEAASDLNGGDIKLKSGIYRYPVLAKPRLGFKKYYAPSMIEVTIQVIDVEAIEVPEDNPNNTIKQYIDAQITEISSKLDTDLDTLTSTVDEKIGAVENSVQAALAHVEDNSITEAEYDSIVSKVYGGVTNEY